MKQTNYDRIKNMSIEEMAEAIYSLENSCDYCILNGKCVPNADCVEYIKQWLESEVKTDEA